MKNSGRFYWCTGCGRWHDPELGRSIHYSMFVLRSEPTLSNFDGDGYELERFKAFFKFKEEELVRQEKRIDEIVNQNS